MNILITYIAVILLSSIPIHKCITWIFYNNQKNDTKLNLSNAPVLFLISQTWSFAIGFSITWGAHTILYYEDDLVIILTLFIGLISFCWSPFHSFKQNNYIFPFILGILSFFSTQFIWLLPLFQIGYLILFNNIELSYIISCLSLILIPQILDTKPWNTVVILGISGILIIKFNYEITAALKGIPTTLTTLFKNRQ